MGKAYVTSGTPCEGQECLLFEDHETKVRKKIKGHRHRQHFSEKTCLEISGTTPLPAVVFPSAGGFRPGSLL